MARSCCIGRCTEFVFAPLIGDGAAEFALNVTGNLGAWSRRCPGCSEVLVWCDRLDEPLEVFRRSWFWPAENDTSSGDDGCDPRLGEELDGLKVEGECGRWAPLLAESVRFRGVGIIGLDSSDGTGDGETTADVAVEGAALALLA